MSQKTGMSQLRNGCSAAKTADAKSHEYETEVIILNQCRKIFIQRDYSKGLDVQFETEYPARFTEKISRDTWENTIVNINKYFADAEAITGMSIFETIIGCVTCYASYLVMKSNYRKKLDELQAYINNQNQNIYHRVGFHIRNPMERGLRVLEIALLMRQGESPRDQPEQDVQEPNRPIRTM